MKVKAAVWSCAVLLAAGAAHAAEDSRPAALSQETKQCLQCHKDINTGMYQEWGESKHFGANVGCYECHKAEKGEKDAIDHNGFNISVIVSPKDCSRCHAKEVEEFEGSHHSKAGQIMGSLDNTLAEVVEGNKGMKTEAFPKGVSAAAVNGCWQCHGNVVQVLPNGKLDPATWPNTGIGRINPDGSEGSCAACHSRHNFSAAQARNPENCGKCHMGPDHPQIEIYNESKHGIAYQANKDRMNMNSSKWVVGEDYSAAPTCATCHMSATKDMDVSHNVGLRIKWNNRPAISKETHTVDAGWGLTSAKITGDERRTNMKKVCISCHNVNFTDNFFIQYEELMKLYHEKFGEPGLKLYAAATKVLKAIKGKEYVQFAQAIDFTWYEIWHHEGRRARHGAAMMAPDYTHWHGTYEVAKHWAAKYIPELKELIEQGKGSANKEAVAAAEELETLLTETLNSDNHKWFLGKEDEADKAERAKNAEAFKAKYAK
ncbi:MAG: multiheme c-type cytochrome [Candidatus Electronema sp. V4]|uniref:multiheme c-type cytochrome n=1 Tax=Candidatus Electronema sp. V4 TaxID=3454756 RepID=UPI0040553FC0